MCSSLQHPLAARLVRTLLLCTMLMLPGIGGATAQSEAPASTEQPETPSEFASPRDTIRTFLASMAVLKQDPKRETAWDTVFDAMALPAAIGNLRKDVAWKLHAVYKGLAVASRCSPETSPERLRTVHPSLGSSFSWVVKIRSRPFGVMANSGISRPRDCL